MPVGGSEYMSRELWDETKANFTAYFPEASNELVKAFDNLGSTFEKPQEMIAPIIEFLELLSKE